MILPGIGAPVDLKVYDMTGREVFNRNLQNVNGKRVEVLDLSSFSKGVYQLAIFIEGRRYVRKISLR